MLSERLSTVIACVTPGNRVADIGCDHGFTSIGLIRKGISPFVVAADLRTGPLAGAKQHVAEAGYTDKISVRLSDGLEKLEAGEVDTILVSGMGGDLVTAILDRRKDVVTAARELVLQPQSELVKVRHYLDTIGYVIVDEKMVYEDEKFYTVMKCENQNQWGQQGRSLVADQQGRSLVVGEKTLHIAASPVYHPEFEYVYGYVLSEDSKDILAAYLDHEEKIRLDCMKWFDEVEETEGVRQRRQEIETELSYIKEKRLWAKKN